jgi:hypothetical protein
LLLGGSNDANTEPNSRGRVCAVYGHTALNRHELTFTTGDFTVVLEDRGGQPGWWRGRLSTGGEGLFASNYVERVEE